MADWKTLDFASHGVRDLIVVRLRTGEQDWSVDVFHSAIYKGHIGRWLKKHQADIALLSGILLKEVDLVSEVFPSERIVKGKQKKQAEDGLFFTMATPAWLLLFLLWPNCSSNSTKSRVKKDIAEKALHMLKTLVQIAYEGHTGASASGAEPHALHAQVGSAKVCADGTLVMDSKLAAWRKTWSVLESEGNRVPSVQVHGDSVASVLWLWSRVIMTHRARGSNVPTSTLKLALNLVSTVLQYLHRGLSRWAAEKEEPCTAQMIALQRAGKRTHPGILTRLLKINRKGKAVRSWAELGLPVETSAKALNQRTAAEYMWTLRRITPEAATTAWQPKKRKRRIGIGRQAEPFRKRCRQEPAEEKHQACKPEETGACPLASGEKRLVAEIIFDSTHFATKDIQINIIYCPVSDIAAYVPPMTLRHIRWRTAEAGEHLSEQDWEQFQKSGFRARVRMESFDCIKYLNHIVEVAFGKALTAFVCPASLDRMEAGSVRIYHQSSKRWYRVRAEERLADSSASVSGAGGAVLGVPELPNALLDPCKVNVLLATLDQKQSQWTAMHCCTSPRGLNLMFMFRNDSYHRSWRDMKWAENHAKGGFHHSSCQLNYALNVNYQQGFFWRSAERSRRIGR